MCLSSLLTIPQETQYELYRRLRLYAKVNSFVVRRFNGDRLTIQFATDTVPPLLRKQRSIYLGLRNQLDVQAYCKVNSTKNWDHRIPNKYVPEELLIPPADKMGNIVYLLDDDCLREIFELFSSPCDLVPLTKVCERFDILAHAIFRTRYRQCQDIFKYLHQKPVWFVEEFFQVFGKSIEVVDLPYGYRHMTDFPKDVYFCIISEHCTNLQTFHWAVGEQLTIEQAPKLRANVKNLHLEFDNTTICLGQYFPADTQIEKLTLEYHWIGHFGLPTQKFPKLTELTLKLTQLTPTARRFLFNNRQIHTLTIEDITISVDEAIEHLQRLRSLTLRSRDRQFRIVDVACFKRLPKIRTLVLDLYQDPEMVTPILKAINEENIPLTQLLIRNMQKYDPELVPTLMQMKTLEFFSTIQFHYSEQVSSFTAMPRLREFGTYSLANVTTGVIDLLLNGGPLMTKIYIKYGIYGNIAAFINRPLFQKIDDALLERPMDFKMVLVLDERKEKYKVRSAFLQKIEFSRREN